MNRSKAQKEHYDWNKTDKWIIDNPDVTFPVFKKAFPDFPFTDATYYGRRRKLTGGGRGPYTRKTLYETIGTIDAKELSSMNAISAMKRLLSFIDKHGKEIEIVRLADPDSVEIRRFTR